MNEPWGISGPGFIALYLGLLVVPALVLLCWITALRYRARAAEPVPSTHHLAYLFGGPDRVTETAIAALLESERLRVGSTGGLTVIGKAPAEPVEGAVWRVVDANPGVKVADVRRAFRGDDTVTGIAGELAERGLVVPQARLDTAWRAGLVLYGVVFAIGLARWMNGVALHRPVGILVFLLFLTVGLAALGFWVRKRNSVLTTGHGARALLPARTVGLLAGAAGAVVLGGLMNYPDDEISTVLAQSSPDRGSWAGGSSCSSGGGGSSCGGGGGGGGCGGGGCGG